MLRANRLTAIETRFVELYCQFGESDGKKAALTVDPKRDLSKWYLSKPMIQEAIEQLGGPKPTISTRPLTAQEHKFLDVYLESLDISNAATAVNITTQKGTEWMKRPHMRVELDKRLDELRLRSIVKAEEVVEEIALIAFSDITEFCTFNGTSVALKDSANIPTGAVISEVSQGQHGVKIKMHNKLEALTTLAKYMGLFKERVEITGKDGGPIQMESPLDSIMKKLNSISANTDNQNTEGKNEDGEKKDE